MKSRIIDYLTHPERLFALLLAGMAVLMFVLIGGMREPYSPGAMAASTYPRLVLVCIMALSCVLLFRPVGARAGSVISTRGLGTVLLTAGYVFLIEPVGFFILTPVFLLLLPLLAGYRHHAAILASSVLVTVALYAVFVLVLNIPLPAGILGD